jgi:hypothetical protein
MFKNQPPFANLKKKSPSLCDMHMAKTYHIAKTSDICDTLQHQRPKSLQFFVTYMRHLAAIDGIWWHLCGVDVMQSHVCHLPLPIY